MSPRAALSGGIAALALAGALVAVGRWEEDRAVSAQLDRLEAEYEAVGGRIDSNTLSAYRIGPPDCLFYELGGEPFAVQLCFDSSGRLIEAAHRGGGEAHYWSLAATPGRATIRVERDRLNRLLDELLSS